MAKAKLRRSTIEYYKPWAAWEFTEYTDGKPNWYSKPRESKRAFIKRIVAELLSRIAKGEYGFSLRIYKRNGQVQEERTYPRSADPKRSKG